MKIASPPTRRALNRSRRRPASFAFDVALSFAGEDREYVERVADRLKRMGLKVFYDKYERITLWGRDLYSHLTEIYSRQSRYAVMFVSKSYKHRLWTNHERRSAQERAFREHSEYILPVRFDATRIPGLLSTTGYLSAREIEPDALAELIKQKIGPIPRQEFFPDDPDRLFSMLRARSAERRRQSAGTARALFGHMRMMTVEERQLLSDIATHSCPYRGKPASLHLRIDYLARLTHLTEEEIRSRLARLDCLGVKHRVVEEADGSAGRGGIARTLRVSFEPLLVDEFEPPTDVFVAVFGLISSAFCPEHARVVVGSLDFSVLSTLAGFPERPGDDEGAAS